VAALREQRCQRPILDLGCGDGLVTSLALGRVEVGVDPDERALERAERLGTYQRVIPTRIQDADIPDASIATVVSNSVLEHVPALDDALQAVARVLRPAGRLIFTAPTETFGSELLLPLEAYGLWRNRQLEHLNLWTAQGWADRLSRAGLDLLLLRPYLRPSLVRAWDALELSQQVSVARRRVLGLAWRRIPPAGFERLAEWAAHLDLSSPAPGGGRLIVARKR
jgi:SAM-dependent methyltransferase